MELTLDINGAVVERSELLNGTLTVTLEGATADGGWTFDGIVSWSRGLIDYPGEGDITLVSADDQIFGTLVGATLRSGADDPLERLDLRYEIDGGEGGYEGASGSATGALDLEGASFRGRWVVTLDSD